MPLTVALSLPEKVILVRPLQFSNALYMMFVTESGIVTLTITSHWKNKAESFSIFQWWFFSAVDVQDFPRRSFYIDFKFGLKGSLTFSPGMFLGK